MGERVGAAYTMRLTMVRLSAPALCSFSSTTASMGSSASVAAFALDALDVEPRRWEVEAFALLERGEAAREVLERFLVLAARGMAVGERGERKRVGERCER